MHVGILLMLAFVIGMWRKLYRFRKLNEFYKANQCSSFKGDLHGLIWFGFNVFSSWRDQWCWFIQMLPGIIQREVTYHDCVVALVCSFILWYLQKHLSKKCFNRFYDFAILWICYAVRKVSRKLVSGLLLAAKYRYDNPAYCVLQ